MLRADSETTPCPPSAALQKPYGLGPLCIAAAILTDRRHQYRRIGSRSRTRELSCSPSSAALKGKRDWSRSCRTARTVLLGWRGAPSQGDRHGGENRCSDRTGVIAIRRNSPLSPRPLRSPSLRVSAAAAESFGPSCIDPGAPDRIRGSRPSSINNALQSKICATSRTLTSAISCSLVQPKRRLARPAMVAFRAARRSAISPVAIEP